MFRPRLHEVQKYNEKRSYFYFLSIRWIPLVPSIWITSNTDSSFCYIDGVPCCCFSLTHICLNVSMQLYIVAWPFFTSILCYTYTIFHKRTVRIYKRYVQSLYVSAELNDNVNRTIYRWRANLYNITWLTHYWNMVLRNQFYTINYTGLY